MKNGKHKIIRLIRLIVVKKINASLSASMVNPQNGCFGVSGFQVQDTHNASCFTNMTWIGLNLSDWEVTQNI